MIKEKVKEKRQNLIDCLEFFIRFLKKNNPHPNIQVFSEAVEFLNFKNDRQAIEKIKLMGQPSVLGSIGESMSRINTMSETDKKKWILTRIVYIQVVKAASNFLAFLTHQEDKELICIDIDILQQEANQELEKIQNQTIPKKSWWNKFFKSEN